MTLFILCLGLVLFIPSSGFGNILHVPGEFNTIQAGIDAAVNDDTVLVAAGTYTEEGNKNLDYKEKRILLLSENGAEQTIIDCEFEGRGFYFHCGEDSLSILDGFTVMNGFITGDRSEGWGGGIRCDESSPTILNCIIKENEAFNAAGIYCFYAQATVIGCELYGNVGEYAGGIRGASLVLDCDIYENSGRGIDVVETVTNCNIFNNYHPAHSGGGLSSVTNVANCNIYGNTGRDGGGISASSYVRNCIITGNTAISGAGGITSGGIIENCIIAGNIGSGIYSFKSPDIENCTIVGNSNGGVKCSGSYAYATIVNCIFWDNGGLEIADDNGWTDVDYSTVQGVIWPGTGNIMSNPRFVDPRNGDFRLLPESPCIDAGDPSYTPRTGGGHRIDMGAIEHFLGFNFAKGAMSQTRRVPQDYPTIQEAIDVAVYLDTILVADGTYTGEGNKNIEFLGKTIIVQSENGPESTVIDCENDGRGFYFNDHETPEAKLVGFTIMRGYDDYYGGGIRCKSSSPTILNCKIIDCETDRNGGGISCFYTSTVIANSLIANNRAAYGGGLSDSGDLCLFLYNTTLIYNEASQIGGAMQCGSSSSSIMNCTIYGNTAPEGSGLYCGQFTTPVISNCIFWDDPATEINNDWAEPIITYSDIAGGWEGEGNINSDPLFLDPENGDFHLTIDSPCIDAGTLEGAPEFDFEGDPRPLGDGVDMGADEYCPGPIFLNKSSRRFRAILPHG